MRKIKWKKKIPQIVYNEQSRLQILLTALSRGSRPSSTVGLSAAWAPVDSAPPRLFIFLWK